MYKNRFTSFFVDTDYIKKFNLQGNDKDLEMKT